ncbi:MAG: C1 family peptidase [Alphaproteobacteria bacterium]|nr:C1 family peptidase [Alphaproteobacteria bacterium]
MKASHTVHKQQISLTQKNILAGRNLATLPDIPDIRDRYYEPALIPLKAEMAPRPGAAILDQGTDGACTGFGLAAVINALLAEQGIARQVSPWMLYEMARCHDEWPGESYVGSSPRGALRGWANNGVCPADLWGQPGGILTPECAKAARDVTIGAYYRLRPELVDFHAALNECGVLYVSAAVHQGWEKPKRLLHDGHKAKLMTIIPSSQLAGYHAFAVVGYNDKGFWVQNSWGPGWGDDGVSLWLYEDWAANIQDAWVVRLALATPQMFGIVPGRSGRKRNGFLGGRNPRPAPTTPAISFISMMATSVHGSPIGATRTMRTTLPE